MKQDQIRELCLKSCRIVEGVADFLLGEIGKVGKDQIEEKSLNSLVSYVDKSAEEQLVVALKKLLPASTFLTEEETVAQQQGEYQWIIDPLDGTTNFLFQLPVFAISLALRHQDETLLGIVQGVSQRECFYAWKGGGAYLNGKPVRVSTRRELGETLIATGFPYRDFSRTEAYLQVLKRLMTDTRGLRRMGAAAIDLAYVACGRFDAFFEYGLSPWDVAAGILLVEEAGGQVSDFKSGENSLFGGEIIAANREVHAALCKIIEQFSL